MACVFALTMHSLIETPLQLQAAGAWGSRYDAQEPKKPGHVLIPAAAAKKPVYGIRRKNLETCTEALGCETGAVDISPAGNGSDGDGGVETECAERKRRARDEEEEMVTQGRACRLARRPLPPPLTTIARGSSRVRMVHERRDGRLEVYAVRTPGVLKAERSGGRFGMRLVTLPGGAGNAAACGRQGSPQAEHGETNEEREAEGEGEHGVAKYVRGGRCVEPEGDAASSGSWTCVASHAYSRIRVVL